MVKVKGKFNEILKAIFKVYEFMILAWQMPLLFLCLFKLLLILVTIVIF